MRWQRGSGKKRRHARGLEDRYGMSIRGGRGEPLSRYSSEDVRAWAVGEGVQATIERESGGKEDECLFKKENGLFCRYLRGTSASTVLWGE